MDAANDISLERFDCVAGELAHYQRVRRVLHSAQHPAFLGPEQMERCLRHDGHVWLYMHAGEDIATLWTEPQKGFPNEQHGFVLSVIKAWKGRGIARRILVEDGPRFGRAIDGVLAWFADCGYQICGEGVWKHKRHVVYPVSRDPRDWPDPASEAGKQAAKALAASRENFADERNAKATKQQAPDAAPEPFDMGAAKPFVALEADSRAAQLRNQLALLDTMLQAALRDGKYTDALKIQTEAATILRHLVSAQKEHP